LTPKENPYYRGPRTRSFYQKYYVEEQMSMPRLGEWCMVDRKKIYRELVELGFQIRSKTEAHQIAVRDGFKGHPTEGRERRLEERTNISRGQRSHFDEFAPRTPEEDVSRSKSVTLLESLAKHLEGYAFDVERESETTVRISNPPTLIEIIPYGIVLTDRSKAMDLARAKTNVILVHNRVKTVRKPHREFLFTEVLSFLESEPKMFFGVKDLYLD
jgi:hypothetical protein